VRQQVYVVVIFTRSSGVLIDAATAIDGLRPSFSAHVRLGEQKSRIGQESMPQEPKPTMITLRLRRG
jgi:hypothetical protein